MSLTATIKQKAVDTKSIVSEVLKDLSLLKQPAVAAGVVAIIVTLLPGVAISATAVAGVLVGVGTIASFAKVVWERSVTAKVKAALAQPPASRRSK